MAALSAATRGTSGYLDPLRHVWTQRGAATGTDLVSTGRPQPKERFWHLVYFFVDASRPSLWASGIRGIQAVAFQVSNPTVTVAAWLGDTDAEARQGILRMQGGTVFGPPPAITGWLHLWVSPGSARASGLPSSTDTPQATSRGGVEPRTGLLTHGGSELQTPLWIVGTPVANRQSHVHRVFFLPEVESNDTFQTGIRGLEAVALQTASKSHRAQARVANASDVETGRVTFSLGLDTVGLAPIPVWLHTWARR